MRKNIRFLLIVISIIFVNCTPVTKEISKLSNSITQVSTIDALLAGVYDGHITLDNLLDFGDFGLGTFDKLDGEMLILDGIVYQIKTDGKVYTPADTLKTPFAAISKFETVAQYTLEENVDLDSLKEVLNKKIINKNQFYGIKITGTFKYMKTRSVPAQKKPYPLLVEVVKKQSVFEMENIQGTIVGYFCPDFVKGINVPGYHLHFISKDLKKGGHILGLKTQSGKIEIDSYNELSLILPQDSDDFNKTDLDVDREDDLDDVEKE